MSDGIPMERMTPEEIDRLRLRYTNRDGSAEVLCSKAWAHISLQDAEIERLRGFEAANRLNAAQVAALRAEVERLAAQVVEAEKYNGWHQRACLENERLRAALTPFACDCGPGGEEPCHNPENCSNYIARAALEERT